MPAFPDAAPALERLRAGGVRVAALTNSPAASARQALEHAGLADRLERILSADDAGRLKPAPEPYHTWQRATSVSSPPT